jgi:hypothetical protein
MGEPRGATSLSHTCRGLSDTCWFELVGMHAWVRAGLASRRSICPLSASTVYVVWCGGRFCGGLARTMHSLTEPLLPPHPTPQKRLQQEEAARARAEAEAAARAAGAAASGSGAGGRQRGGAPRPAPAPAPSAEGGEGSEDGLVDIDAEEQHEEEVEVLKEKTLKEVLNVSHGLVTHRPHSGLTPGHTTCTFFVCFVDVLNRTPPHTGHAGHAGHAGHTRMGRGTLQSGSASP